MGRTRSRERGEVNWHLNTQLCLLFGLTGKINCVFQSTHSKAVIGKGRGERGPGNVAKRDQVGRSAVLPT